ncbi:uncharacterized protein METZ01_LOCUS293603 [marine metagenome]|uniref:Calcium/calmodulin-dependent protein kinase II association-domain domain-containing protein n=1 Tax=marine metagenome TaxID=408172 RepID=A0A382LVG7_9ZZZZ
MKNNQDQSPEIIIDHWAKHLNNGNLDRLLKMYHIEATLLPTFSPNLLSTPEQIKEYFVSTIENQASVEIDNGRTIKRKLSENIYLMTGFYIFYLDNNHKREFKSQFTFLIDLTTERPIQHHHSSQIIT